MGFMQFMMEYGWAILVVLAAIAALGYFGVFNMHSNIEYHQYAINCSGSLQVVSGKAQGVNDYYNCCKEQVVKVDGAWANKVICKAMN